MGHAALMVARCTACGADKQLQPAVSVRSRIAIADNGNVVEEQQRVGGVEDMNSGTSLTNTAPGLALNVG